MDKFWHGIKSVVGLGSSSDQPLAVDTAQTSFELKPAVAQGTHGTIHKGKYKEETCAVKVFSSGIMQKDAFQESEIASIIQYHPNVVVVYGLWYCSALPHKQPALIMEMCSISLDAYLKEKVHKNEVVLFQLEKRLDILNGVASGMTYLHHNGIVHGNLCAKKVLLNFIGHGPSHDQKLTAKVAGANEMKLFNSDTVKQIKANMQRSSIMPPEVRDGGEDMELTKPVDVFSFGCLVAHVACCVFPEPNTKAGLNEFERRAIPGNRHPQIYQPLMKKCLAEVPTARETFEDIKKELSVHQSKNSGKQAQKLEEEMVQGSQVSTLNGGSPGSPVYSDSFLPHDLVVVSGRSKKSKGFKLGEGSIAYVYKGLYSGKPCAVKIFKEDALKKEFYAPDPGDELHTLLPNVQHTNIVQVFGMWYDIYNTAAIAVVMELCDESLAIYMKTWKKLSPRPKRKLDILREVAEGMSYLHYKKIIHGNLHTGNVLVCHFGDKFTMKLADFDMAKYIESDRKGFLATRFPEDDFFPPEMFQRTDHKTANLALLTPQADVFCFGELALEVANGSYVAPRKKKKGHNETLSEVQRREKQLSNLKQSEKEFGQIIRKCLADAPEERPSFTGILQEIDKYQKQPDADEQFMPVESESVPANSSLNGTNTGELLEEAMVKVHRLSFSQLHRHQQLPLSLESSRITTDYKKIVGTGSIATVYQGKYRSKICAIKVFNPGTVRKDLEKEPQLSSIIQHHPNVVLIHGLWYGDAANQLPGNQPALVMELCNTSLSKYLKEKKDRGIDEYFHLPSKVNILRDVAAGMLYLHSVQIMHGNLSANTVLLNVSESDLIAKVTGFNFSRPLNPDTVCHITATRSRSDIMPPEVKDCKEPVDLTKAVDVYSFGCLIPHVASCVVPDLSRQPLGATSEFRKRCSYVIDKEKHIFCTPLMEKCLAEIPEDRMTFRDIIVHLKKYSRRKQVQGEGNDEMQEIENLRSQLLLLQRNHANLKDEKEELDSDMKLLQEQHCVSVERSSLHVHDTLKSKDEVEKLMTEKQSLEQELGGARGEKQVVEKQKQLAYQRVADLESEVDTLKTTVTELRTSLISTQQQLTKEQEMAATQRENEKRRVKDEVAKLERQLDHARAQKDKSDKERKVAVADEEQTKNELANVRDELAKEIEQNQERAATASEMIESLKQKLKEAKEKEQKLNAEVRQYRDDLKDTESARDRLGHANMTLQEEKTVADKQVRDLTTTLQVRMEDLDKKEDDVYKLKKELEAVKQAIEKGWEEDTILREHNEKLTEEVKDRKDQLEKKGVILQKVQKELAEAMVTQRALEGDLEEKGRANRELEGDCDRLNYRIQELESALGEKSELIAKLEGQHKKDVESCQQEKKAAEQAKKSEQDMQKQFTELYGDHEALRRKMTLQQEEKENYNQRMTDLKQQKKAELQAAEEELNETREQLKLHQRALDTASLKLEAKEAKIERLENDLKGMAQSLESKQEDLEASKSAQLDQQRHTEELQDKCGRFESSRDELQLKLSNLIAQSEELEGQLEDEADKCRHMEGECNRLVCSKRELETMVTEMKACNEDLRIQLDDKERKCHDTETERAGTLERAEDLQKQLNELHKDHETLRKVLQEKKTLIDEMVHHKHKKEEQFEVVRQSLKAKEKEYFALEDAQLNLLQRTEELETDRQDFEAQVAWLNAQVVPVRVELARVTEERDALRGQLRDFAVTKAENESLRNEVKEKVRYCKEKAKELDKQQMELATARRHLLGQFVSKKNLESTVKKSVRESFTESGVELLNASGMEASGSEGSESSLDNVFVGGHTGRADMKFLAQQSQQKIKATEGGKRVVEEDLEMKEGEIQFLQHRLKMARQEILQLKSDLQIAETKAQECVQQTHKLAESYFESHRLPPCLYQLHQRGLPSFDINVESASEMCKTVEVSEITDLRLFCPDASWCDTFRCLLDELRSMPNKDCQASVSLSFLDCSGVITFYRFHIVLVPQVLSCEPEIHSMELEGGAKPKALLVYAHAPLGVKDLTKEFGIATHAKGVLLAPEFKGDISKLTMRLDELEDIPPGLKEAERYLDTRILRELQRRYRVFATPRTVPTVPRMGVAMAII